MSGASAASATPAWADFPTDEYAARLAKAQRAMQVAGIELLMLAQKENVEYLSGFRCGHWASKTFATAILLVHATRDPVLVVPDFFAGTARGSSWIAQHAYFSEPHARPRGAAEAVINAVRELVGPAPVIGLESGQNLVSGWNLADYHAVREGLPAANFTSAAEVLWACRMIKSPREIERLRTITQITERAMVATRDQLHAGMTETEIAATLAAAAHKAGADGVVFTNIRAGLERYPMVDGLPADRPIAPTEMLVLHPSLCLRAYVSELSHNTHIGTPTAKHHEVWATIVRAQEAMLAMMRPGARARDVFETGHRVLASLEFGRPSQYCGHGIGTDVVEPPFLSNGGEHRLEVGMVFALEPWIGDARGLGIFGVGEMVAITDDGADLLSTLERDELWWTDA